MEQVVVCQQHVVKEEELRVIDYFRCELEAMWEAVKVARPSLRSETGHAGDSGQSSVEVSIAWW